MKQRSISFSKIVDVDVSVEVSEIVDQIRDETLLDECCKRNLSPGPVSNDREKRALLLASSDALQAHGHFNLALRLDELRDELGY